jgi:exonuclease SbcC
MKIKQVIIEGFRAYQTKEDGTFDFTTSLGECANFVSIYAPNGFGKTSFYDAVEWNLTNNVGRFVRDQTRTQNDAISRSQNQEDRKQHILRNRFISENSPSQVTVITDTFESVKKVTPARRGSRDYLFEKDTKTGALSDIFLSQEAIDAFLREERPEARYSRFMDSFGDEDEIYRGNLTALRRELKLSIVKSKEEETKYRMITDTPVNPSIFEEINKTIDTLRNDSEEIATLVAGFGADDIRFLRNVITKRTHELDVATRDAQSAISELSAESDRLTEVSVAKDNKLKAQSDISALSRTRELFERRERLLASISRLSKRVTEVSADISRLKVIADQTSEFLEIESKSTTTNGSLRTLQESLITTQSEISSFHNRAIECRRLLAEVDAATNTLNELRQAAESIFQQLDVATELKTSKETDATATNLRVQLLTTKIENQKVDLKKVEAIEVSEATIDSADVSALARENFSLVPLKAALLEKQTKLIALQGATRALDQVQSQASQFSTLIALGTELVANLHSNQCPLCSHRHESHTALVDRILQNPALTEYEADAVRSKDAARREFEFASEKLISLIDEWKSVKNKVILTVRATISTDEAELRSALTTAQQLDLEIRNVNENIKQLRLRVLDRSKDQLSEHINTQLALLAARRQAELKDLENCTVEIEKRQQKSKADSQTIEQLRVELQLAMDTESYRNVLAFKSENAISPAELPVIVEEKKNERERELLEARTALDDSTNELSIIDRDSPTVAQLTRQSIDDTELQGRASIAGADAILISFVSNVRRRIAAYDEKWSMAEITANIAAFISQTQDRVSTLTLRSGTFLLLGEQLNDALPFMQSISAKKELDRVVAEILQQEALLSELDSEYAGTIERLQGRIRGFFYTDLINAIYRKIDPHPDFKKVLFDCEFSESDRPRLNVLVADENGEAIVPSLYFSAAQVNILSLSIFLARALHVKQTDGSDVQCIFIDDPIHSMDSINVLSTIDLLRSISNNFDRQIILSTHDRNFFDLLKRKIPEQQYGSKFIELETFGRVRSLQDA